MDSYDAARGDSGHYGNPEQIKSIIHCRGGRPCTLWDIDGADNRPDQDEAWTRIARPLRKAAISGALSEVQWLVSLVPAGPVLEALKSLALAQAAISMSGAICKWLLDNGANGNIYVVKGNLKEALVAHVYRQDGHIDSARPVRFGSSPVFVELVKMLLPKACSDMEAMRDLAEAVSKQADSASLQMMVAQLPRGPATTLRYGHTMLHVLAESANEYLETLLTPQQDNRYTACRPFGFCDQHHVCCQHCYKQCTDCQREAGRRKELFKMCLTILIDLGVPMATVDDFQNTAADLCSEHFKEGGVLLMEALQAHIQNAHGPRVPPGTRECSICMQQEADSVLVPCGHLCVCHCCASRLQGWCPICRANLHQVVRVYHT